jgi:hypothetical protein
MSGPAVISRKTTVARSQLIAASSLLIEIGIAAPVERDGCRLCGSALRVYERPERICDGCLRANQTSLKAA